jgi:hypothetical protein
MTNEKQKPTTDKYRNNWDEIFDKNLKEEPEDSGIEVDVEATNDEQSISVTKTWSF